VLRLTARAPAAVLIAAALLAGGPALAAPGRLVTAPAGWRPDPEQEAELARRFAAVDHFGGLAATTAAEAHVPPRSNAALFATRATAALPAPEAAARAARAALDELRATTRRASLTGGAAEEQAWQERVEADARQVTAILHWREPASHTVGNARIVVVSDGRRIAAVTGECLAGDGADRGAANACIDQLASLDPGIPAADRVALAPAPAADPAYRPSDRDDAAAAPAPAAPPATMAPAPDSLAPAPPRISDGTKIVLPPMVIPQDRQAADRRPVYFGAGLIVLAVVFWWNRRRRDRFEHEDGIKPRRARRPPGDRADADADDLHAAAAGDDAAGADADADDLHAAAAGDAPAATRTPHDPPASPERPRKPSP
jgi:hypothetical protein